MGFSHIKRSRQLTDWVGSLAPFLTVQDKDTDKDKDTDTDKEKYKDKDTYKDRDKEEHRHRPHMFIKIRHRLDWFTIPFFAFLLFQII